MKRMIGAWLAFPWIGLTCGAISFGCSPDAARPVPNKQTNGSCAIVYKCHVLGVINQASKAAHHGGELLGGSRCAPRENVSSAARCCGCWGALGRAASALRAAVQVSWLG